MRSMSNMFKEAASFNQNINAWDVSSVTDMQLMFENATSFNQNISSWNVSCVTNMYCMFAEAISFNQDIGSWDVSKATNMNWMFYNVTLSTANYSAILTGWAVLPSLQSGVNFHGGNSKYNAAAISARDTLTGTYGWTITDGGLE